MPDRPPADPPVAGFAECRRCTYLRSGTPGLCFACFRSTLPFRTPSCAICDHPLEFEGVCNNPICGWSLASRQFEWVRALSLRSGEMERAINDFKYEGRREFAPVFARLLLGYLAEQAPLFRSFDLVIPSPSYAGPGATRAGRRTRESVE